MADHYICLYKVVAETKATTPEPVDTDLTQMGNSAYEYGTLDAA